MTSKTIFQFLLFILIPAGVFAQSVGINNPTPDASAALDVVSTTKGMLIPRMTSAERAAITTPATGLMVYQTDGSSGFYYYDGTSWVKNSPSQLEKITEGSNTGFRLMGIDPANYGDIGDRALDLSFSEVASTTRGATGRTSVAMGNSTTASESYSTAMGSYTTASGPGSTALGVRTTASGQTSTSIGDRTTASGDYSLASGGLTTASGRYSTAMGFKTTTSGTGSTALGLSTTASGQTSTALGQMTTASGQVSTSIGVGTAASSYAELAVGSYNTEYTPANPTDYNFTDRVFVVGIGSGSSETNDGLIVYKDGTLEFDKLTRRPRTTTDRFYVLNDKVHFNGAEVGDASQLEKITEGGSTGFCLLGRNADNYGNIGDRALDLSYSNAASTTNGATGLNATALGVRTTASGQTSTSIGDRTTASGDYSLASGGLTTASGDWSLASGGRTTASGNFSSSLGFGTTAKGYAETVIGSHNTDYTPASSTAYNASDRAFVVGIGSGTSATNDGLIVYKDGTLEFDKLTTAPTTTADRFYVLNDKVHFNGAEVGDASQLEKITEGGDTGFRLLGSDPENYGNIGFDAIDLSFSNSASTDKGARGYTSFATGRDVTASGYLSFVAGEGSLSSSNYSVAMGYNTKSTNTASVALGYETEATGVQATAMGYKSKASNVYSFAVGDNATASGPASISAGYYTKASAGSAVAMGENTTASGYASTSFGQNTTASATNSTALGNGSIASGYAAFAVGASSTASGSASAAIGNSTTAKSSSEIAVGSFNTDYTPTFDATDRAFVVGIGTSLSTTNDGLIVYKDGTLELDKLSSSPTTTSDRLYVVNNRLHYDGNELAITSIPAARKAVLDSDSRLKLDNGTYSNGLNTINNIKIHDFTWKSNQTEDVGVFAQELYKAFPLAVIKGDDNPTDIEQKWQVDYRRLVPVLISATQELTVKNENLSQKVSQLEKQNTILTAQLDEMETLKKEIMLIKASLNSNQAAFNK